MTGHTLRAYQILASLLAASGATDFQGTPAGCRSIPEKWWRERFYEEAMPAEEQGTKKRAFRRAADNLVENGRVGMAANRIWLAKPEGTNGTSNGT